MNVYEDFTNEEFYKAFGDLLRVKKIVIADFAKEVGISTQYIYQILNKKRKAPNNKNIKKISSILDIKPEYFLEYRVRKLTEYLTKNPSYLDECYVNMAKNKKEKTA